jgi:hypothetical protein
MIQNNVFNIYHEERLPKTRLFVDLFFDRHATLSYHFVQYYITKKNKIIKHKQEFLFHVGSMPNL